MNSCAITLFLLHLFNVNDIFLPVILDYFGNLLPFVVSSHILLDGQGLNIVHLSQIFGKRRHNLPVDVGRYTEMPFMVLAPFRSYKGIQVTGDRDATKNMGDGKKQKYLL